MKWQPTFTTPSLRAQDWLLPATILGAVFIHGIAFYLVQAAVPTAIKKNPASARISILAPANPIDRATLDWIAQRDPAIVALHTAAPLPPGLFSSEPYRPSYETTLPEPLPRPRENPKMLHRSVFPPGPVPEPPLSENEIARPLPRLLSKVVASPFIRFSTPPPFHPPLTRGEIPLPARFLIVQAGSAEENAIFLLQSSGNDTLDDYSRQWLAGAGLTLLDRQTSGWVQVHWGREIWEDTAP